MHKYINEHTHTYIYIYIDIYIIVCVFDIRTCLALPRLSFHIERFSGVVLLLVTCEDLFRMQLLPQDAR